MFRCNKKKCNRGTKSQKWKYNGKRKEYISMKNKKCLDVAGKKYDNGSVIKVVIKSFHGDKVVCNPGVPNG